MNPFDQNDPNDQGQTPNFINLPKQWGHIEEDSSSDTELTIVKVIGAVKQSGNFIIFLVSVICLLFFTVPVLRFAWEFSIWSYHKIGHLFH